MPARDPASAQSATLAQALRALSSELRAAGISSADQDARLLVSAAAGLSREDLIRMPEAKLPAGSLQMLAAFRSRRLAQEPVSRILGERHFYGRPFRINASTLDPRPETETLVDAALELVKHESWTSGPLRILDVGTGSGCLLATLLAELPGATGLGTDICPAALAAAAENAARTGVGARARFAHSRSLAGIDGEFAILVSNPPYIPSAVIETLERGVRDYDPRVALDGGADGLAAYREIADGLITVVPDGWALFEVGAGQAGDVGRILQRQIGAARIRQIRMWTDLGGHDRVVAVRTQL